MKKILFLLVVVVLVSCKKKDDPKPTTIFEGFTNKSFYGKYYNEIINHTWTTFDNVHTVSNRLYFRGDGNLYVQYNIDQNGEYVYSGTFDIPGDYNLNMQHYGDYIIDSLYLQKDPVTLKCYLPNLGDTTYFYRDRKLGSTY
jgi:hypothetical protein